MTSNHGYILQILTTASELENILNKMKRWHHDLQPWQYPLDSELENILNKMKRCPHDLQPWKYPLDCDHNLWTGKYIEQDEKTSSWPPTLVISSRLWPQPSELEKTEQDENMSSWPPTLEISSRLWPQPLNWKIYWTRLTDVLMTSNLGHIHQILTATSDEEQYMYWIRLTDILMTSDLGHLHQILTATSTELG